MPKESINHPFSFSLSANLGSRHRLKGGYGSEGPDLSGLFAVEGEGIAGRRVGHPCDLRIADLEVWGVGQNSQ
jgi:hypothetical protein